MGPVSTVGYIESPIKILAYLTPEINVSILFIFTNVMSMFIKVEILFIHYRCMPWYGINMIRWIHSYVG